MSILVTTLAFLALAAPAEIGVSKRDRAEARRLKNEAFEKISEGSYARGIDLLEAAYQAVPHPTFLFNIAVVYDQWPGHCPESLEAFDRFFEACAECEVRPTAEKRFQRTKDRCEVALSITSVPSDCRVVVDEELQGRTPFETTLRPGRHRLRLEREGFEPHVRDVLLEPGRDQSVAVTLVPRPDPEAPRSDLVASAPARAGTGLRAWGWVSVGAGAVGLGMGTVYTILALDSVDEEEELRQTEGIDPGEVRDARDEARSRATLAYVGYGIGVAGIGTGILLHVLAGQKARDARTVSVGTDGRGLVISGRF